MLEKFLGYQNKTDKVDTKELLKNFHGKLEQVDQAVSHQVKAQSGMKTSEAMIQQEKDR